MKEDVLIFLCSTWSEGTPPQSAAHFFEFVNDCLYDFRVDKNMFEKTTYACFGLGGAVYGKNFGKPILEFDKNFTALGGVPLLPGTVFMYLLLHRIHISC